MTDLEIEKQIISKGLTGVRLTPQMIDDLIVRDIYHVFEETTTTVCCLVLKNGFTVVGKSACIATSNFDAEIGRKIAFANAKEKIWDLAGYNLKEILHIASTLIDG